MSADIVHAFLHPNDETVPCGRPVLLIRPPEYVTPVADEVTCAGCIAVLNGRGEPASRSADAGLRHRPGDQPLPVPNDSPDVHSMVIADIEARREVGISRYGTALQPHNGRDALRDAYEEAMDLTMYLRQIIAERDEPKP